MVTTEHQGNCTKRRWAGTEFLDGCSICFTHLRPREN